MNLCEKSSDLCVWIYCSCPYCIVGLSLSIISFTYIDQHQHTAPKRTYPYEHVLSSSRNRSNLNVPLFACYLNKSHHINNFETNHDQSSPLSPNLSPVTWWKFRTKLTRIRNRTNSEKLGVFVLRKYFDILLQKVMELWSPGWYC